MHSSRYKAIFCKKILITYILLYLKTKLRLPNIHSSLSIMVNITCKTIRTLKKIILILIQKLFITMNKIDIVCNNVYTTTKYLLNTKT